MSLWHLIEREIIDSDGEPAYVKRLSPERRAHEHPEGEPAAWYFEPLVGIGAVVVLLVGGMVVAWLCPWGGP